MRGHDEQSTHMFSYLSPEQRVPADHPLRAVRALTDEALRTMSRRFAGLYANTGRPSIPPEQLPRFGWLQHRRLARPDDVCRPAHRGGRVGGHHLPDHQPIEQTADGGQMLLDRGGAIPAVHLVDVGGHRDR